jgi:hypothetical protein
MGVYMQSDICSVSHKRITAVLKIKTSERCHYRVMIPVMCYNSRILLLVPEVGWNIMGTMWMFGETVQCSSEHFTTTVTEGSGSSVRGTKMKPWHWLFGCKSNKMFWEELIAYFP